MRAALGCLIVLAVASAEPSPCQTCCSPGGDCSKASHGQPGVCCGAVNGQAYCCPTYTTGAKCFACNLGYRCYMGTPSRNICANDGGIKGGSRGYGYSRGEDSTESFITMVIAVTSLALIFSSIMACMRQRRTMPLMHQQQTVEMQVAKPVTPGQAMPAGMPCATAYPAQPGMAYPAQPGMAYPMHPGMGYPAHGYGGGYGGGSVAMGAGMGFLGGMMVGDMMSHHHGGYGGGDCGGGYGGGDCGGGGGGDFAADM